MSENRVISQDVPIKKCRLCMCYRKLLINLYDDNGMLKKVAKVILEMLQYEVSEMDGFPPYICTACSDKLWEFKAFKLMCDSAFEILSEEKERRSEISFSYLNANAVKEGPVVNDSTSSQCIGKEDNMELQVPERILQSMESTNTQLYESESLKSDVTLNSQDFVPHSNKLEGNKVVTSKTSHIKSTFNQEAKNEKKNPEEVGIVDRDDAILNDNMIGSLQFLIDKTSHREVRSEELLDDIIVLKNYGKRKRQAVVLSSDTETSGDENVELSSGEKRTAKKKRHEFNSENNGSDFSSKNVSNGMRDDLDIDGPSPYIRRSRSSSGRLSDELMQNKCSGPNQVNSLSDSNSSSSSCCIVEETSPIPSEINGTNEPKISCESYDISERDIADVSPEGLSGKSVSENLCIKKVDEKKSGIRDGERLVISPLFVDLEKDEVKEQQGSTPVPKLFSVIGMVSGGVQSGEFLDEGTNESSNNQEMFEKRKHAKVQSCSFKCEICSKSFAKFSSLKQHIKTHPGGKAHICSICGEGFKSRYQLKMHLYIHSGEKIFKCQFCCLYTTDEMKLKAHVEQTHLKSHDCVFCGLTFPTKGQRNKHKRLYCLVAAPLQYRPTKSIICDYCGLTFTSKKQRNKHKKKHSRIMQNRSSKYTEQC